MRKSQSQIRQKRGAFCLKAGDVSTTAKMREISSHIGRFGSSESDAAAEVVSEAFRA